MTGATEIRGLFFDLDGTLCDTDSANYEAYAQAFREAGLQLVPEPEFIALTNGMRADAFIRKLQPGISNEVVESIRAHKMNYYPHMMHLVKPNAELISFLRVMAPHHITALVTTAQEANAAHVLESAGISELFRHRVFGGDVEHAKPHPAAYLKALELSGLGPDEVVAFEDSEPGAQAALAAGIRVIRVRSERP